MIMNEEAITATGSIVEEKREGAAAATDAADKSLPIKFKSKKTKSFVNKNATNPNTTDYKSLTHEQLVIEATRLQQHVTQLKNLLTKANAANDDLSNKKKKVFKERPFNFDNYNKRHVLLKFLYLGWNYKVFIYIYLFLYKLFEYLSNWFQFRDTSFKREYKTLWKICFSKLSNEPNSYSRRRPPIIIDAVALTMVLI
jgi:hypothetical protein